VYIHILGPYSWSESYSHWDMPFTVVFIYFLPCIGLIKPDFFFREGKIYLSFYFCLHFIFAFYAVVFFTAIIINFYTYELFSGLVYFVYKHSQY